MKTIEKIVKIALYVTMCVIGFSAIAWVSGGSLAGAIVFGVVLGFGIGMADVLICFMDYFTGFGKNLVNSSRKAMVFLAASVLIYALVSSILGVNQGLMHITTWISSIAFVCIAASPLMVNATMRCMIDMIHHHNERGTARRQKQPEPAEELDYDVEGIVPHN